MRFNRPGRALLAALFASPIALLFSAPALANDSLTVQQGQTVVLDGTVRYKDLHVLSGGKILVRPVSSGAAGNGSLTIKAATIEVDAGGSIDATGAGFPGTATNGDSASCGANAGGQAAMSGGPAAPGGGGAAAGAGATGCPAGGIGGTPYIQSCEANPGAAGGAAYLPATPADTPNHGGAGGGAIILLAAEITINGSVVADGAPGFILQSFGTGGGAGGYISIDASKVSGSGTISAKGGDGGDGTSGKGGGGGGGTIRVSAVTAVEPALDASGGKSGTCAPGNAGIADATPLPQKPCVDTDGDGDKAKECGGGDCDDSDPNVHAGTTPAIEICDGQDNDCNGAIDDDLVSDACPAGQICEAGACVDGSGGGGGATSTGTDSPPDYVTYRGACDIGRGAHENGMAFYGAALVAFLAGLREYRKRRG
ncbi:MAG: putative metal-binding motif-containing protein [Polyangiaceae bacterium]